MYWEVRSIYLGLYNFVRMNGDGDLIAVAGGGGVRSGIKKKIIIKLTMNSFKNDEKCFQRKSL